MKTLWVALFILLETTVAFSQPPDPRDSIILESKTVAPGAHPGPQTDTASYLYIRVFITNKDSLTYMHLPVVVTSTLGGAYATLGWPQNFSGVVNPLTNTLRYFPATSFLRYNSISPDTFFVAAGPDPFSPDPLSTIEPPNTFRKAIWELKFDTVWAAAGTFELDSILYGGPISFSNTAAQDLPVNFVKSVITVPPAPKGDLDWDLVITLSDVALILNCIFCAECSPPLVGAAACDLNCDGILSPSDVILELYAFFFGRPFPC